MENIITENELYNIICILIGIYFVYHTIKQIFFKTKNENQIDDDFNDFDTEKNNQNKLSINWNDLFIKYVLGCLYGLVLIGLIFINKSYFTQTEEKYEHYRWVYSVNNETEVNNDFILGTGFNDEIEYYYLFYEDVRGGFSRIKVKTENTSVFEKTVKPELLRIKKYYTESFVKYEPDVLQDSYILYVPDSTIIRNFKIN